MDKSGRKWRLLSLVTGFVAALIGATTTMTANKSTVSASNDPTAQAYYLGADYETLGLWYTGVNGKAENAENRVYGKDGAVLMYHGQVADGNSTLKLVNAENPFEENYSTFKGQESAHYVEYAPWVSGITLSGSGGMWNNEQLTIAQRQSKTRVEDKDQRYLKQLMYIDFDDENNPSKNIGSPCIFLEGSELKFTISINDDEWHVISLYLGSPYAHQSPLYAEMNVSVSDKSGNLIFTERVADTNSGVYASFAVKGTVVIGLDNAGYSSAAINAIFFDPMPADGAVKAINFNVNRSGAKTMNLSWTNTVANSVTNIYRRIKGETQFQYLATTESGASTYTDTDTAVATDYEYALTSGLVRDYSSKDWAEIDPYGYSMKGEKLGHGIGVKDFNLLDTSDYKSISSAPYKKTYLECSDSNILANEGETLEIEFTLYKNSKFNENGAIKEKGEPYSGREITFKLDGESAYSYENGTYIPNMKTDLGTLTTDENGNVKLSYNAIYPGDYTIVASIDEWEDPTDFSGESGYDKYSITVDLGIASVSDESTIKPILTAITDAVKPGEYVTINGYYIKDNDSLKIAYAPNKGETPCAYESANCVEIPISDIEYIDSLNGGISFTLPKNLTSGVYDFYIRNENGWSDGITLNAARPLNLNQEAAYAGQKIEVVGRNFLLSEFGAATLENCYEKVAVKLTLIKDAAGKKVENGNTIKLTKKNGGVLTGLKETKESALQYGNEELGNEKLTAEAIPYTDEYRLTFVTPSVMVYGTYLVSVSNDGKYFVPCSAPTYLEIVEKKQQNWDRTVFGEYGDKHVGNDPLDLGVYWAQDLNYINVVTMTENTFENARTYTADLNNKIKQLSVNGGGVIYFPEGEYYIFNDVFMKANVMIVGAGIGKTKLYYAATSKGTVWFRGTQWGEKAVSNIGLARMTLSTRVDKLYHENEGYYCPNFVVNFGSSDDYGTDIEYADTQNKFLKDVDYQGWRKDQYCPDDSDVYRQMFLMGANKNIVWKNVKMDGGSPYIRCHYYTTCYGIWMAAPITTPIIQGKYTFIENCYFDLLAAKKESHGLSIRSDTYVGYTYCTGTGGRESRANDGEALLVEVPGGFFSTGKVLGATSRSVTLDFIGGERITSETKLHYNYFAVCITDGKGAGQIRYIKRPAANEFGNCYELLDTEKDWDVIPDYTSVFSIYSPNNKVTVSHYKAYDCVATICLYYCNDDVVVADSTLVDTGGISLWGAAVGGLKGGRTTPAYNTRIARNDISGVGANYKVGSATAQGSGGILLNGSGGGNEYLGTMMQGIVIKDNYLHDMLPLVDDDSRNTKKTGLVIDSGDTTGTKNKNYVKFIFIENNVVENTEWGLYIDYAVSGILLNNNSVTGTTKGVKGGDMNIFDSSAVSVKVNIEFYVDGEKSELSGEYRYGETLPTLSDRDGKTYYGWTTDSVLNENSQVLTTAPDNNAKLYAVFGYCVTFDYNYKTADGTEKGEYVSFKVRSGESVAAKFGDYGDPFRQGKEFLGWYVDKNCQTAFDTSEPVTSSMTVYAKWSGEDYSETSGESNKSGANVGLIVGLSCGAVAVIAAAVASVIIVKKKRK